jgi:hypothetical protein
MQYFPGGVVRNLSKYMFVEMMGKKFSIVWNVRLDTIVYFVKVTKYDWDVFPVAYSWSYFTAVCLMEKQNKRYKRRGIRKKSSFLI